MPICNPYRVEARGSAGSDGNHGRVCLGVGEHVPMPIWSIGRRGSRLQGQCAVCRHDTDQTQSVTRRRRWHLTTSRPSPLTTRHIRNTSAASPTPRITPTVIVADQLRNDRWTPQAWLVGIETTASRFAGAWCHAPTVGSTRPAGPIVLRPCGGHVLRLHMVCGS